MLKKIFTPILFMLVYSGVGYSQSLTFSYPINYLNNVTTDRAIDFTNYKGGYFVSWKDVGSKGNINYCFLGREYDPKYIEQRYNTGSQSAYSPSFCKANNRLYLFWITPQGGINYLINNTDTTLNSAHINSVEIKGNLKLSHGITATAVGNKIVFASHATDKKSVVYGVADLDDTGLLQACELLKIPKVESDTYPFVVNRSANVARFTFKGKEQELYYTDYDVEKKLWLKQSRVVESKTDAAPASYRVFEQPQLFYIWKGNKKDQHIYYTYEQFNNPSALIETALPSYFSTNLPVTICAVDEKKFIMSYVGMDNKLYISFFTNYNPANWIETEILPTKGNLTLKDIVIPGSHDAGLSVLSGVGGMSSGSINECNTLTQKYGVEHQLKSGIRMFDIRVGTFKDDYYTKHCSSDCMSDAIGGAYGESLSTILRATKKFLTENKKEFVIMTLSHFCERETPMKEMTNYIAKTLGKELMYYDPTKNVSQIKLNDLAGKCIITYEGYALPEMHIDSSTMARKSNAFLNIRREYAATNKLENLLFKQKAFFNDLTTSINNNDLVRVDWQLTQSPDEAAMICNDFESPKTGILINSAMLLTKIVRKHKSIIDLSMLGNKVIAKSVNDWITAGVINKKNKPNILYVDVSAAWITDYCIELNKSNVYN